MGEKKSMVAISMIGMISGIFCCGIGFFFGFKSGNAIMENQVRDGTSIQSTIENIAIVNLDNGVTANDQKINYGAKMLKQISSRFIVTGLEDARQGIESGKYASYVVIPATFSEHVVSINKIPQKATVEYAMSHQLSAQTSKNISFEIMNFEKEINNNLGYMYLYSVLNEFHNTQDQMGVIMQNDRKDLEVLQEISGVDLVELISSPEIPLPDNLIEHVDVAGNFQINHQIISDIKTEYEYGVNMGVDNLMLIKEESADVVNRLEDMEDILYGIDIERNGNGNNIYQDGIDEIDEYIVDYNQILEENKNNIVALITRIKDEGREEIIEEAQGIFDEKVGFLIRYMEEQYYALQLILDMEVTDMDDSLIEEHLSFYITDSDDLELCMETIRAAMEEERNASEQEIRTELLKLIEPFPEGFTTVDLSELTDGQEENYARVLADVEGIILVDQAVIDGSISDRIISPIRENGERIKMLLLDEYDFRLKDAENLEDSLEYYDLERYFDREKIKQLHDSIDKNHKEIETAIGNQDKAYSSYMFQLRKSAQDGVSTMEETIHTANEQSKEKVTSGLQGAKTSRILTNEINRNLLQNFTDQLGYTRIGSMENKQVYEFMINPMNLSDQSDQLVIQQQPLSADTSQTHSQAKQGVETSFLLGGILIMLFLFAAYRMAAYIRNRAEE